MKLRRGGVSVSSFGNLNTGRVMKTLKHITVAVICVCVCDASVSRPIDPYTSREVKKKKGFVSLSSPYSFMYSLP